MVIGHTVTLTPPQREMNNNLVYIIKYTLTINAFHKRKAQNIQCTKACTGSSRRKIQSLQTNFLNPKPIKHLRNAPAWRSLLSPPYNSTDPKDPLPTSYTAAPPRCPVELYSHEPDAPWWHNGSLNPRWF